MKPIRCPHCDLVLHQAELDDGWCESCGKRIPPFVRSAAGRHAFNAAPPPPAAPPPLPARSPFRRSNAGRPHVWVGLAVFGALALGITALVLYLWLKPDVEISVDNGGAEAATVLLDGSPALTVPPGAVEVLSCRSGSRRITVERGEKTVFDEVHNLQGGRNGPRKYLLNPEADKRYWVRTAEYGLALPKIIIYSDDTDFYRQTAAQIKLVPVGAWVDVDPDLVLQPAPSEIHGRFFASRTVLSSISKADYDLIAAAGQKKYVSSQETFQMRELVDRLLRTGP